MEPTDTDTTNIIEDADCLMQVAPRLVESVRELRSIPDAELVDQVTSVADKLLATIPDSDRTGAKVDASQPRCQIWGQHRSGTECVGGRPTKVPPGQDVWALFKVLSMAVVGQVTEMQHLRRQHSGCSSPSDP